MSSTDTIDPHILRRLKALLPINISWTPTKAERYRIEYRAKTGKNLPQTPKAFPFAAFHLPTGSQEQIEFIEGKGFLPFDTEKKTLQPRLVFPGGKTIEQSKLDEPFTLNGEEVQVLKNAWNEIQSYRLMTQVGSKRATILAEMAAEQDMAIETRKVLQALEKAKIAPQDSMRQRFNTPAERHNRFVQNIELLYDGSNAKYFTLLLNGADGVDVSLMYREVDQDRAKDQKRDLAAVTSILKLESNVKGEAGEFLYTLMDEYNRFNKEMITRQESQIEDMTDYTMGRRKVKPCTDLIHNNVLLIQSQSQLVESAARALESQQIKKARVLWRKWQKYAKSSTELYRAALKGLETYYGDLLVGPTDEEIRAGRERQRLSADAVRFQTEIENEVARRLARERARRRPEPNAAAAELLRNIKDKAAERAVIAAQKRQKRLEQAERLKQSQFTQALKAKEFKQNLKAAQSKLRKANTTENVNVDGRDYLITKGVQGSVTKELKESYMNLVQLKRLIQNNLETDPMLRSLTGTDKKYALAIAKKVYKRLLVKARAKDGEQVKVQNITRIPPSTLRSWLQNDFSKSILNKMDRRKVPAGVALKPAQLILQKRAIDELDNRQVIQKDSEQKRKEQARIETEKKRVQAELDRQKRAQEQNERVEREAKRQRDQRAAELARRQPPPPAKNTPPPPPPVIQRRNTVVEGNELVEEDVDESDAFSTPQGRGGWSTNQLLYGESELRQTTQYTWNNEQKWNDDTPSENITDKFDVVTQDFSLKVGGKKVFTPPTNDKIKAHEDMMDEKPRVKNIIERARNPFYNKQLKENEISTCYFDEDYESMDLDVKNEKIIQPWMLISPEIVRKAQNSSGKLFTRSLIITDSFDVANEKKYLAQYLYEIKTKLARDVANLMDIYLYKNVKPARTKFGFDKGCFDKRAKSDKVAEAYKDREVHLKGAASDDNHNFSVEYIPSSAEGDDTMKRVVKFKYPPTPNGKTVLIEDKNNIVGENEGDEYMVVMEYAGVTLDKVITYNYNDVMPPKLTKQAGAPYEKKAVENNYWKLRDLAPKQYPYDPYDIESQLKNAVDKLNALGFAHRDIKDENICWDGERLTLIDFEAIVKFYDQAKIPKSGSWVNGVLVNPGLKATNGFQPVADRYSQIKGYSKVIDPPETWKKDSSRLTMNNGCRKSNTCDYYQAALVLMNIGGRMDFINYGYDKDPIDNGLPYLEDEKEAFMTSSGAAGQTTLNMRDVLSDGTGYLTKVRGKKKGYTKQRAAYKFFRYCFFHPKEAGQVLNIPPMLVKRIFSSEWIRTGGVFATEIKQDGEYKVASSTLKVEEFTNPKAWRDFSTESYTAIRLNRTLTNSNAMVIEYDSLSDDDIVEIERAMNVFTHEDSSKKRTLSDVEFDNMVAGNSVGNSYDSSSSSEIQSQGYSYNSSSDGSASKRSRRAYYDSSSDYSDLNASSYNSSSDADVEDMHGTYDSGSEQSDGHLEMDDSV